MSACSSLPDPARNSQCCLAPMLLGHCTLIVTTVYAAIVRTLTFGIIFGKPKQQ